MNSTIELTVRNKDIHVRKADKITTGQQLNKIDIFFDGDSWIKTEKKENGDIDIIEALKVDVVFRIDNRFYRVTNEKEKPMDIPKDKHLIIDIPPNVGAGINLGKVVFIGIRGTKEVGDTYQIVYPTPYFRLGVVEKGATPVDTLRPEEATQTAYDEAIEKANVAAKAAEQSEANAAKSEANAAKSEANAAKSEANAAKSEANAAKSEANAANSAAAARDSETNAANSEANAAESAAAARDSEINAAKSETNAANSEANAANSAAAANLSKTNAANSAVAAKDSEANAAKSKTNAAKSEANAKTSETNAKTSETNAKTSETNAKTSETNAKRSENNAEANYLRAQSISKKYPKVDGHGHWIVWDGTAWVDTGALAKFTIFRTYSTIEAMYRDWNNIHNNYYNNFVLITSQPKANPGKDENIEDDNGKLFIILREKKTDGNDYEKNGFSYVGDLSGAQGIQGESAYDIAVAKGQYTGTLKEFAEWTAEAANNEPDRVKEENTRISNENTRIANENTRQSNETERKTAETERKTAEQTRLDNEAIRVSAETERNTAEDERNTAEDERKTAEGERKTAEDERKTAETERKTAETERKTAEQTRLDNEAIRVFAESAREVWENYIQDKTYYKGNKVALNGNSYICSVESTTDVPGQTNSWTLIAKKGDGVIIQDVYDTVDNLRAAHPGGDEYIYQVTGQNSEFFIWSELQNNWVSIGSLGGVYEGGDGIQVDNILVSARLGFGLKFDTMKKIMLDESVFIEYTDDEITDLYNTVTV